MIPQLDMDNFLLTGLFVLLFFLLFIYMVRIMFIRPIEIYVQAYKEELDNLESQQSTYIQKVALEKEEQNNLELRIKIMVKEAENEMREESKRQLAIYEDFLLSNLNTKIAAFSASLQVKYNEEIVAEQLKILLKKEVS